MLLNHFSFLLKFLFFISCYAENFFLQSAERFDYLLNVLNSGSTSDDNPKHTDTNYTDQDRYIFNLSYQNATCNQTLFKLQYSYISDKICVTIFLIKCCSGLNLPDSPFASSIASGISAVM